MSSTPGEGPQRSVEELMQELGDRAAALVRQEIALARSELAGQAREAGVGAGLLGAAGLLGLLSAGTATTGLILLLARRPRPWLAAFTVTGGYAGAAALLAREGRRRLAEVGVPVPEQTVETLKETAQWAKNPHGSATT